MAKRTGKSYYAKPAKRAPRKAPSALTKAKAVGYAGSGSKISPAEIKFKDTTFASVAVPAGPASLIDSTVVAEIVNGTGPSDRIGRRIKVVKVDYSFSVVLNGAAGLLNTDAVRYDMWLDRQCNGIAPLPAELYTAAATVGTTQFPNLFNEKRFKRMYTKVHQFNPASAIGAASANVGIKIEGSFKPNCIIEYDATTGNITDLTSNNLFQCWSSDSGYCVVNTGLTRVHYVDA